MNLQTPERLSISVNPAFSLDDPELNITLNMAALMAGQSLATLFRNTDVDLNRLLSQPEKKYPVRR